MNKEEIIKAYAHDYRDMALDEIELAILLVRCSNEIIEKLIADINNQVSTHTEHNGRYCDTGEDMEWSCRSECVDMALNRINQLKAKWL